MASGRWSSCRALAALLLSAACSGKSTFVPAAADAGPVDAAPTDADTPVPTDADTPDAPLIDPTRDAARDAARDGPEDGAVCYAVQASFERPPQVLVLAVPTSDAMNADLSDGRTRFDATRSSLLRVLEEMDPRTQLGLVLNPVEDECSAVSTVAPAALEDPEQRAVLAAALEGVGEPAGSASLLASLRASVDALAGLEPSSPAILLFLDGTPVLDLECNGEQAALDALTTEVRRLIDEGIAHPYFVAAPGSGAGEQAKALADATGCGCDVDFSDEPDFVDSVLTGFRTIDSVDLACDFAYPGPPDGLGADLGALTLTMTLDAEAAEEIPRREECDDGPGFTLDADAFQVTLCPATCERLVASYAATVDIELGCKEY